MMDQHACVGGIALFVQHTTTRQKFQRPSIISISHKIVTRNDAQYNGYIYPVHKKNNLDSQIA